MRVLIVDDDDFDLATCRSVLERLTCEVVEAMEPQGAIDLLDADGSIAVIISDYDLKAGSSGIDVLAHAMRVRPGAKRILMSGLLPFDVLEQAREDRKVEAFFDKPDTLAEWETAVRNVLPGNDNAETRPQAGIERGAPHPSPPPDDPPTREESLEAQVRWLQAVVDLGAEAHSGASLQETFDRAVAVVSKTLDMEYVKILRLLPDGKEMLLVAGVGWKPGLAGKARVSTGMDSQAGYTLASAHPVVAEDLRAETRFSGPALLHEHGVISGLSVVIPGPEGKPWGVFGAHTREHRRLSDDHALFLRAVANVVAGAIQRDHAEDTLLNTKEVLERAVADRTRELRAAIDDLQAFNAAAAHDLRAPLRVMIQSMDLFLRRRGEGIDAETGELVSTLQRAAGQLRDILEDLLILAKATRDPLRMEPVDLTALVKERWGHVVQREPDRDVRFRVEDGLAAHADPRLLGIVLDNLLGNAFKFTRHSKDPRIEVGSEHLPAGGTAFFVRDNGAGFPPENAAELFQPFKRLHPAKQFEGTGIGLATVRRIIERHGGTVHATSSGPGEGATIRFRLLPAGLP